MRPFSSSIALVRSPTILLALLLSLSTTALAAPVHGLISTSHSVQRRRIEARQNGQTTFQTVTTSQTPVATITETCQITLTPSADGQSVDEAKSCTYEVVRNGAVGDPPQASGDPNNNNTDTGQGATDIAAPTDAPPNTAVGGDEVLITIGSTIDVGPGGAATTPGASPTTDAASPTDTAVAPGATPAPPIREGGVSFIATDSLATPGPAASTSASAEAVQGEDTTPGRKLEVLPIGLGVFAGISVIALIVVGLVTYERTKYRKAFRQRKLAETGANMGYGGMAEIR